jgi:hypothetical protein
LDYSGIYHCGWLESNRAAELSIEQHRKKKRTTYNTGFRIILPAVPRRVRELGYLTQPLLTVENCWGAYFSGTFGLSGSREDSFPSIHLD